MSDDLMVKRLLDELDAKMKEVRKLYTTLQTLKEFGGDFDLPDLGLTVETSSGTPPATVTIRNDEFFQMKHTDAVEKYLRNIGHASNLKDIYDALIKGGLKFTGDGKKSLNVQLTKATRKFAKIGSGPGVSFGLLEWYPGKEKIKRVRFEENKQTELEEIKDEEETTK